MDLSEVENDRASLELSPLEDLVETISEARAAESQRPPIRQEYPVVGVLWGLDEKGTPLVRFEGAPEGGSVAARSVVPLNSGTIGCDVVLMFEQGDLTRPLIMGILRTARPEPIQAKLDGEKLVFTADREIVLSCGDASITLTAAGKVLIRGTYVLSRSSGANRIKGAAVEIN